METITTSLKKIESELIRLKQIVEHIDDLIANHKENQTKFTDDLNNINADLSDQIKRVQKRRFEIAIVGNEKAGKSSLLNAWIGYNICPTDERRCTYTTMEINSTDIDSGEQKYEIEYFTTEEYDNSEFKTNLTPEEINEMNKLNDEIKSYLNKPLKSVKFDNFDAVKADLTSAICQPGHARAVKKISVWTQLGISNANVVMYDVPGYNSPISMHKMQTRNMIANADAVIYAKKFTTPDLVESELDILEICDSANPYLKAKDKLIVALTCCDEAGSSGKYQKLVSETTRIWREYSIEQSRIIPVCSRAELKQNNPETARSITLLKENNGGRTGFLEIKDAVSNCVTETRINKATERCAGIMNKINDLKTNIFNSIKATLNVDENTEINDTINNQEMDKIYKEWFSSKWKQIEADFQKFYQTDIRPKLDPDAPNFLSRDDIDFKELYDKTVDDTFKTINATKKDKQTEIYRTCTGDDGVLNPSKANIKIRAELSKEFMAKMDRITDELTKFLWKKINRMIEWIR